MSNPLFDLKTGRFRFICTRNHDIEFQNGFCARLRGNIGFLIKKNCCLYKDFRSRACPECIVAMSCSYPKLFSPLTPPPTTDAKGRLRIAHPPPRPFVLSATPRGTDDSLLQIDFCLFGPALEESAFFLDMAGNSLLNIHGDGIPFLEEIVGLQALKPEKTSNVKRESDAYSLADWIDCKTDYKSGPGSHSHRVALTFRSPFCHKKINGAEKFNLQNSLPEILLKAIIRRLRDLKRAYGEDTNMGKIDGRVFSGLKNISCIENTLRPATGKRYSYSQEKAINLTGVTGRIVFDNLHSSMLPFLQCCGVIHAGKGTSWGLGNIDMAIPAK